MRKSPMLLGILPIMREIPLDAYQKAEYEMTKHIVITAIMQLSTLSKNMFKSKPMPYLGKHSS
jgi:hypothetical protein